MSNNIDNYHNSLFDLFDCIFQFTRICVYSFATRYIYVHAAEWGVS